MKKIVSLIFCVGIVIFSLYFAFKQKPAQPQVVSKTSYTTPIHIKGIPLFVSIADTDPERIQGLSGTEPLKDTEGMLFVFDKLDTYVFWMKDMNYPLDIIWLDNEMRVIHIEKNLAPDTYPKTYTAESPARYVLETKAGFSDANAIAVGDILTLE
jgi:uncharacterized membrane protein (UPF0127 family)